MTFLAPERLALVALPIALAIAYLILQRRRSRYAMRFASVDLLDQVAPDRPGWRRHVAALAFLAAVCLLVVGMARPAAAMEVPAQASIVLALDVSYSMEASDVSPNRLAAAQDAARRFLGLVPDGVRVGLVAFSGSARALVPPTIDRTKLEAAIDRLRLGPGTAIGEAIYVALEQLPKAEAPTSSPAASEQGDEQGDEQVEPSAGSIVVLSDGKTTAGRSESGAARAAAGAGVPISTIAFGTASGVVTVDGQRVRVPVDKAALKSVARTSGGRFFEAASADQLRAVFEDIGTKVGTIREEREVTDLVVGAALLALVGAAAASLAWFSRLP
jgi:Ca-activated chloride channel family protein